MSVRAMVIFLRCAPKVNFFLITQFANPHVDYISTLAVEMTGNVNRIIVDYKIVSLVK